MGFMPVAAGSLFFLTIVNIIVNITVSLLGMTVNGLAAHDTPHELKGRVSGYMQAGNLGGSGLGGGLGLWLAQHTHFAWLPGASLAAACALCCVALFYVKEQHTGIKERNVMQTMRNLWRDIWNIIKARAGILALILCFLPLGTGSAANLFAAVANQWKASADTVALVTGTLGAVITAIGCFAGGYICDRINRQAAYVIFGLLQAVCAIGMAFTPHTEFMYIVWVLVYSITNGLCYAAFSAFVLEVIGKGAAGTKFTVYSSLSNAPIYYMTLIEGEQAAKHGIESMLNLEAIVAIAASIGFIILIRLLARRRNANIAGA
jgi:MFS family permease